MIFDILNPIRNDGELADNFIILRPLGYSDVDTMHDLMDECGFKNHFICNAGGYENAIALFKDLKF